MPLDDSVTAIDRDTLQQLQDVGGPELLVEIVDLYLGESPQQLADLVATAIEGDLGRLEQAAHRLKSASAQLGAGQLAGVCADIEMHCLEGAAQDATALVPRAQAAHAAAAARLAELRDAAQDEARIVSGGLAEAVAS